jgi:lysophospholipase L1-like esterase
MVLKTQVEMTIHSTRPLHQNRQAPGNHRPPRRRSELFAKLVLAVGSIVLSVCVLECGVRAARPQDLNGSWFVQTSRGVMVNKSQGSARHQLGTRVVAYSFSRPHLRGSPLRQAPTKVLVLGDSFTFGWLLSHSDTYVHELQARADQQFGRGAVSLLNAATGGWGTSHYLAYLEEFGEEIEPDLVLAFLNTDDIGRSIKSRLYRFSDDRSDALAAYDLPISRAKRTLNRVPFYPWLLEHSHFVQLARKTLLNKRRGAPGPPHELTTRLLGPRSLGMEQTDEAATRLGRALFRRLHGWCESHGVDLIVSTTHWHSPRLPSGTPEPTAAFMRIAEGFFAELEVPYLDESDAAAKMILQDRERYILEEDHHPSEQGADLIAQLTWPLLREAVEGRTRRPGASAEPSRDAPPRSR